MMKYSKNSEPKKSHRLLNWLISKTSLYNQVQELRGDFHRYKYLTELQHAKQMEYRKHDKTKWGGVALQLISIDDTLKELKGLPENKGVDLISDPDKFRDSLKDSPEFLDILNENLERNQAEMKREVATKKVVQNAISDVFGDEWRNNMIKSKENETEV